MTTDKIKRYHNWCESTHSHQMAQMDDGDYVRFEDYQSLVEQYSAVLQGQEDLRNHIVQIRDATGIAQDGEDTINAVRRLQKELQAAKDKALEHCATICDYYANRSISDYSSPEWGCEEAAKEFRELKSKKVAT